MGLAGHRSGPGGGGNEAQEAGECGLHNPGACKCPKTLEIFARSFRRGIGSASGLRLKSRERVRHGEGDLKYPKTLEKFVMAVREGTDGVQEGGEGEPGQNGAAISKCTKSLEKIVRAASR
jgi:hypothetical protein